MFCTKCGSQVPEGNNFCTSCGATVTGKGDQSSVYLGSGGSAVGERSIVLYIILSLLTCGLFAIYWFIVVAGDIRTLRGTSDPNGILDFIIGVLTCGIYTYVCYYRYSKYIVEIQQKMGRPVNDVSVLAVILAIFVSLVSLALIQNEINNIVRA
jgi:hypothetical protein